MNKFNVRSTRTMLVVLALLVAGCGGSSSSATVAATGGAGTLDPYADYGLFLSILPPGQADCPSGGQGQPCPANFTDQLKMYENLVFTQPGQLQTVADLVPAFYKNEAFVAPDGTPPAETRFVSIATVTDGSRTATLKRDSFGVPYIYGTTRSDVMFGTGYASAEDRMFLMDVLRHVGRGRQSDFLGGAPPNDYDRSLAIKAGYDENELQAQVLQLATRFGADGEQVIADSTDYVAGVNRYIATIRNTQNMPVEYNALQLPLINFTERDVVAIATLVQAIFAVGGGSEHQQVKLLHELLDQTGDAIKACQLWRDLRHFDDPEKQTTASTRFETQSPPTVDETDCPFSAGFAAKYPGAVLFDRGSLQERDPLTVVECFLIANPAAGQPACPNFRGDVTDDPVAASSSPPVAFLKVERRAAQALPDLAAVLPFAGTDGAGGVRLAALPPPWRALEAPPTQPARSAPSTSELAMARKRALDTVQGVDRALAMAEQGIHFPHAMSNALLVAKDQTADGRPLAIFGPQTGYTAPQLLLELNQQGGDIHSRGTTFAGLPYVVIGRGVDHAWSATSSSDDITDVRVLRLCNRDGSPATRDSTAYIYKGVCKSMFERTDEWTAEYNAGAPPPSGSTAIGKKVTRRILRAPDYGPVFATATVNGAPVALATQRSTYFGEVDSAIPFVRTSRNQMQDPQSFYDTFNKLTGTFNWLYIDANNIAYFNSGLLPVRAAGIHPDLPQWGDGNFDWKQTGTGQLNPSFSLANFLPLEAHPHEANPASGYLISWNNSQAPGFWAADNKSNWGPLHRSLLLEKRLKASQSAGLKLTPASIVELMEDAGTTDQRGQDVLPAVFAVLDSPGPALTPAQQTAINNLKAWVADGTRGLGAQRRDRDGPGLNTAALRYAHRDSVVLMDRWWNTMINDALPQVSALEGTPNGNVVPNPRHDTDMAKGLGSAFNQGYYGYMRRVMDMSLGRSAHPYQQLKCAGTGTLADCRAALVSSLQEALDDIAANGLGSPEVADSIRSTAVGLATVPAVHWVNRPTWQQVVQPTATRH